MCLGTLCGVFAQIPPQDIIPEVKNIVNSRNTWNTNSDSSVALVDYPNFECSYNYYWDVNLREVTEGRFTDATADAITGKLDFNKNTIVLSYGGYLFELSIEASDLNSKLFFPIPTISLTGDEPVVSSDIITD